MASLRKHRGRYSARFYDSDRSPKRKEVALGTSRKSVAEPRLRRLEEAYARGDYAPWNGGWRVENESVEEAIGRFLDAKRRDGLQERPLDGYEYKLNNFSRHAPMGTMMRDAQPDHVHSLHPRPRQRGTGLRRGELLNLQWGDGDVGAGRLVVRNREDFTAKNGNERTVPLRGDALDTLREMREARTPLDNEPVFVDADGDVPKPDRVSKRFKFYVRKAGLSDREELSFHSCRHTTGSWLSMQGVPLRVISEILGHSNTQVTEMYSHLSPEVMDRAMEATFGGDT